jgi:hypothetical protein
MLLRVALAVSTGGVSAGGGGEVESGRRPLVLLGVIVTPRLGVLGVIVTPGLVLFRAAIALFFFEESE